MSNKIIVAEVGPRDGFQNETKILDINTKVQLIEKVIDAGYKVIEFGSFVSPSAIPALADSDDLYQLISKKSDVVLRALITNLNGLQRAADVGVTDVLIVASASNTHNLKNLNRTTKETIDSYEDTVLFAKEKGINVTGSISTSFGCPYEGQISLDRIEMIIHRYLDFGINEISIADTTGMGNPMQVKKIMSYLVNNYPNIKFWGHFHNTRNMATANVYAALEAGITRFDSSFGGLGGCPYASGATGNICSEDLIHMLHEMGMETGIDLDKAISIAKHLEQIFDKKMESYILKAGKCSDLHLY